MTDSGPTAMKSDARKVAARSRTGATVVTAGIVAAAFFSSCAGGGSPARQDQNQKRDSSLTLADSEPRFAYGVGGGFSGEGGDRVTITSAGKVTLTSPYEPLPDTWTISSSQVAQLTALFSRLGFLRMRTTPDLDPRNPDAFSVFVTFRFRGRQNTVAGGQGGKRDHPFWRCYGALATVASERRRAVGQETLVGPPARIDSIAVDGRPVAAGSEVRVVGRRPHRISWRGVAKEGSAVTGFSIAIWRGWSIGSLFNYALDCPNGDYDCVLPDSGFPYCVTPVVHFGDKAWSWEEFNIVPTGGHPSHQNPGGAGTPRPPQRKPRMTLSERNRVGGIAVDGKSVAPGDTVRVEASRPHRISWHGICADGCRVMRFSIAVRAGYNGGFIHLANSCPDGYYDYTFPGSRRPFWLTPRVDFTDYTYAWEGFYVIAGEHL